MEIQLPYDIMELIMNKKHQLEIEELKAAHTVDINKLIWNIENMIEVNFEEELDEFAYEEFNHLCSEDRMSNYCLDYSQHFFENEYFRKMFSDILLYRWQEYILHNDESGQYPYDDESEEEEELDD